MRQTINKLLQMKFVYEVPSDNLILTHRHYSLSIYYTHIKISRAENGKIFSQQIESFWLGKYSQAASCVVMLLSLS